MEADYGDLHSLNMEIGKAESEGNRRFFENLLAPAFAMSRANGVTETRETFLNHVMHSSPRSTQILSRSMLGTKTAAVTCLVEQDGKTYENYRVFVRQSVNAPWRMLAWVNEPKGPPQPPPIAGALKPIPGVYGLETFKEWRRRLTTRGRPGIDDLSDTKFSSGFPSLQTSFAPVKSYADLADIVSFLAVMNKNLTLLFRGQTGEYEPIPALLRSSWPPGPRGPSTIDLEKERLDYWKKLNEIGDSVVEVLDRYGLPRHKHMRLPYARWAVIQHYELLPTPMMDFTTSLRVAASFAFGLDGSPGSRGFIYVTGTRHLRSDLMTLGEDGDAERSDGLITVRLNAVCPPRAKRPHLQEGVLASLYPFDKDALEPTRNNFLHRVIAKIELANYGDFWPPDFPIHSRAVLLPTEENDDLLRELQVLTRSS